MKTKAASGAKIAATVIALIRSGAVTACAEEAPKAADRQTTEKWPAARMVQEWLH